VRSWEYINTYNNRPFYYSKIRINPLDDQRVYVLTTRFMVSEDGGRTLRNGSEDEEIHGDFHALWLDPNHADRYYIGMDKGAAFTHDHGESFIFYDNLAISQYYRIGVDMRDPYWVYGGHQDNGTWGGPSFSRDVRGILNDDNWKLHWGDGMDIQIDPTDWRKVYSTAENGKFRRYDALTYRSVGAMPSRANVTNWDAVVGPDTVRWVVRFNWSAPLVMSPHDPRVLYLGGNHLFRTTDGGDTWTAISPDLSKMDPEKIVIGRSGGITPDNTGAEHHGTITSMSESSVTAGGDLGGDGRREHPGDPGRGRRAGPTCRDGVRGVPAIHLGGARRGLPLPRRHRLRDVRRPPGRRLHSLDLQDHGLRCHLAEHHRQHPGRPRGACGPGGSPQPGPPLRRHRVRPLRLPGRGGNTGIGSTTTFPT
jgi:hypothetical protein